jgi:hypothetical protein
MSNLAQNAPLRQRLVIIGAFRVLVSILMDLDGKTNANVAEQVRRTFFIWFIHLI